jgi:hypothetical protein
MTAHESTAVSVLSRRTLLLNGAAIAAVAALPNNSTATQKEETMTRSLAHRIAAHFAAWERPAAVVADMRTGFKSLRT